MTDVSAECNEWGEISLKFMNAEAYEEEIPLTAENAADLTQDLKRALKTQKAAGC